MTEFYDYVKERKQAASGARHRVCGSKSKKCSLPSDGMTQAQWKKKNGEVISVNLNQPMIWEDFIGIPVDLQREYVKKCCATYGCSLSDLSEMFSASIPTVRKYFTKHDIGADQFHAGKRMTKDQKEVFRSWLGRKVEEKKPSAKSVSKREGTVSFPSEGCSQVCFTFSGQLNYAAILQSVYQFVGDAPAQLKIIVDKGGAHE